MNVMTEGNRLGDILKFEAGVEKRFSRDNIVILSGQNPLIGAVLGKIGFSVPTTGTAGSNTGNGTMTGVSGGANVKVGTYTMTMIAAALFEQRISVEDLAAAADIAARPVFVAPFAGSIQSIGILTEGSPAGIDDSNTVVIAIADAAANTILTKTFNTANQPPSSDYADLGAVSATHKWLNAGEKVTIAVTQGGSTSNMPAFSIQIVFKANSESVNTGLFSVVTPSGGRLKDASVGSGYTSDQINFTINDGSTDFAVGDSFTVAVAAGTGKYRPVNFSGTDGSENAAAVLLEINELISTLKSVAFTSGGTYQVMPGDQITGATSGATGRIRSITLSSGSYAGGDAAGTIILDDVVGTFQSENLNVGSNSNVATIGADASAYYPDRDAVGLVREAVIDSRYLVWPAGATANQKATALAQLADRGIIVRTAG